MPENNSIARPYATAVYELARESSRVPEWSGTLDLLALVTADADLRALIFNPKVSRARLQELVLEICGEALDRHGQNLVKLLIQAERLHYAPHIRELYEQLRAQAEGRLEVTVVTAYELDQQQRDSIAEALGARSGKTVNVNASIDESLIGGAIIRMGDAVVDASLRGRLDQLRNELARG